MKIRMAFGPFMSFFEVVFSTLLKQPQKLHTFEATLAKKSRHTHPLQEKVGSASNSSLFWLEGRKILPPNESRTQSVLGIFQSHHALAMKALNHRASLCNKSPLKQGFRLKIHRRHFCGTLCYNTPSYATLRQFILCYTTLPANLSYLMLL